MNGINKPKQNSFKVECNHKNNQHNYKRTLSQICASTAESLLLLDLGLIISVPTIVIGVLYKNTEGLSLDDSQASWFGSLMFLCQPFGSIMSGCLQSVLGRKKSMLIVNVPHLVGWYLLYSAESVITLYTASIIMGFGLGFLEAPTLAYVGEITEARLRGMLTTFTNSNVAVGTLLAFTLSYFLHWRIVMLTSCLIPVIAAVCIFMIPESPVWLLTKGRKDEAMASLKWLRGWVSDDEVSDELHRLDMYCQASNNEYKNDWEAKLKKSFGYTSVPDNEYVVKNKPDFYDGIRDFLRPGVLKPLQLVSLYFFFALSASLIGMKPYMIEVFKRLQIPMLPNTLTVVSAGLQFLGSMTCICILPLVGKRVLSLVCMTSCALCCLLLSAYTYATKWYLETSIPLILFCFFFFVQNVGVVNMPWLLISEVFPTRGRGLAGGVCAAICYGFTFLMSKTWFYLLNLVELHGCFLIYGIIGCIGVLYLFIYLPETEGKSLAEIENNFTRKIIK